MAHRIDYAEDPDTTQQRDLITEADDRLRRAHVPDEVVRDIRRRAEDALHLGAPAETREPIGFHED